MCHNSPTAGHQGTQKTLKRIRREHGPRCGQALLGMHHMPEVQATDASEITTHKLPIGRPWQMIAIDILEVPVSTKNSRYLLVIQDYFTKWADARPLPDQTTIRITAELVKLFCTYGVPEIVHSDQG